MKYLYFQREDYSLFYCFVIKMLMLDALVMYLVGLLVSLIILSYIQKLVVKPMSKVVLTYV